MKNIWAVLRKELLVFFVSPAAYVVLTGFLSLSIFFFFVYLASYNAMLSKYAAAPFRMGDFSTLNLNERVIEVYFHTLILLLLFMMPLLSMRMFAEERRQGTFEFLFTSPLKVAELVWGKYLSLACVVLLMSLLGGLLPLTLYLLGQPEGWPIVSGLFGVVLSGLLYASLGLACSALSDNQIVAGIMTLVTLLVLYLGYVLGASVGGTIQLLLEHVSPAWQVMDLLRGVVSVRSVIYFSTAIAAGLFVCQRALDAERWR